MRKAEQRLWDSMLRNKPRGFWLNRIENIVEAGTPDVYVVAPPIAWARPTSADTRTRVEQRDCWVELKAVDRPKRDATRYLGPKKGLRVDQISFHAKAASVGLRTYVLIRDQYLDLYLIEGRHAKEINDWSFKNFPKYTLAHDWKSVYGELE